jgi:WXG100 family type VII secretion target
MVTPEMKAGTNTLQTAAGMVATAKGDFDKLSSNLSNQILSYQSQWVGQGGSAFFALHQAWTEKQNRIVNALNEFENALTQTQRDNTNTDEAQHTNMSKLTGRLDGVPNV